MRFLIDTGSAWLWMPGIKCTNCTAANTKYNLNKALYNGPRSTTFRNNGLIDNSFKNKQVKYALGEVRGDICTDEIRLHEAPNKGRVVQGAEFIYANFVGSPFDQMVPEGVLGLGPKARALGDPEPII